MNHAQATKLLNASWDSDSDNIHQDAKAIYESGFQAALNLCTPLLDNSLTLLRSYGLAHKTQAVIEQFLEGTE